MKGESIMLLEIILCSICSFIAGYLMRRKPKKVGTLVIDVVDPMNDTPFSLELNKSVEDVYFRKEICLDVDNGSRN